MAPPRPERSRHGQPAETGGRPLEDLCFHAQQAAEKAVKAVLVLHGIEAPRTHDVSELLGLVSQAGHVVPEDIWEAEALSDYAVMTRYPGHELLGEEDHRRAVAVAERVVRWAQGIVDGD